MALSILTLIFSSLGLSAIMAGKLPAVKNISVEELEQKLSSSGSSRKFIWEKIILPLVVFYKTKLRLWFYHFGEGAINKFHKLILKVEKNIYFFSRHLKKKKKALEMDLNNGSEFLKEMNNWKQNGTNGGTKNGTKNNGNGTEKKEEPPG